MPVAMRLALLAAQCNSNGEIARRTACQSPNCEHVAGAHSGRRSGLPSEVRPADPRPHISAAKAKALVAAPTRTVFLW